MKKTILCLSCVLGVIGCCSAGYADDDWEDVLEDRREAIEEAREERRERLEDYYDDLEDYYEDLEEHRHRGHHGYYRPRRSFGFSLNLGPGYSRSFYGRRSFYDPWYGGSLYRGYSSRYHWRSPRPYYFDRSNGHCW